MTDATTPLPRFAGRTCLITGSTGIAAASAVRMAAEGARVFLASRTEAHCAALEEQLRASGADAGHLAVDLTEPGAADAVVQACVARFGRLDALFNVAGGSGRRYGDGPVHEASLDAWDATLDLNARSLFLMCGSGVRQMLHQDRDDSGIRGAILNMSSILSVHPSARIFATHAYTAAKGAIDALTRGMAASYAPDGIRVNTIAPSVTHTPMAARAAADPDTLAYATWKQPLVGGFLRPEDVAGAAAFLLSDDARAITGQRLQVDGGASVTDAP